MSAYDYTRVFGEPPGPAEHERVQLEARTYAAQMKTTRREWEPRTEFRTAESGDDFVRNQLTHTLSADIYAERVDTGRIHGQLQVECDYERVSERTMFVVVALAMIAGAVATSTSLGPWLAIGAGAAIVLLARLIFDRWGIRAMPVTTEVPVSADRITWASYPDAPLPVRDRLGQPVRVIELASVAYRKPEDR